MTDLVIEQVGEDSFAVVDRHGDFVADGCFGIAARVPDHRYPEGPIDFAVDLRRHDAAQDVVELVICEVQRRWKRRTIRTTASSFDEGWIQTLRRFRFRETEIFRNPAGREFVVYVGG